MSSKIALLSEQTINQIAAGEVIENPASVVKELVENSIDAGASQIVVETKGGGLQMLRISDNGSGMGREDALLCLERHATSKIRTSEDLFLLHTMGFRGEALASIASISKLTLTTSLGEGPGTQVEVEGGIVKQVEVFPRNRGTTIEVRSLFYNVPARKKFQKSAAINSSEITRTLTLLSLAYPEIGFTLMHQDSLIFKAAGIESGSYLEKLDRRMKQVLGEEFFSSSPYPLSFSSGPVKMQGFLSDPLQTRNNRTGQYLFINRRAVLCPLISYAIKDGYGMRLAQLRHPLYILHVEIPAKMVDVNVHPQKKEVRLHEEKYLKEVLQEAVNGALQQKECKPPSFPEESKRAVFSAEQFALLQEPVKDKAPVFTYREDSFSQAAFSFPRAARVIGLFSFYLLIDCASVKDRIPLSKEEGILLVDLMAARARVSYDSLIDDAQVEAQSLLLPISLSLPLADAEVLEAHLSLFEKIGISIRLIGKNSFLIDALPKCMEEKDAVDALHLAIEELRIFSKEEASMEKGKKALARTVASYVKDRKGSFTLEEASTLFEELLKSRASHECPKGKPTYTILSTYDIEKLFAKR